MNTANHLIAKIGMEPHHVDMQGHLQGTIDTYSHYNLPPEFFTVLQLEKDGGPCPRCGTYWEKVDVDWGPYRYHYFDPACECFPRCPQCGTSWHRLAAAGNQRIEKCDSCSWTKLAVYVRICRVCKESFRTDRNDDRLCAVCEEKGRRLEKVKGE